MDMETECPATTTACEKTLESMGKIIETKTLLTRYVPLLKILTQTVAIPGRYIGNVAGGRVRPRMSAWMCLAPPNSRG